MLTEEERLKVAEDEMAHNEKNKKLLNKAEKESWFTDEKATGKAQKRNVA